MLGYWTLSYGKQSRIKILESADTTAVVKICRGEGILAIKMAYKLSSQMGGAASTAFH
eukprot:gene26482-15436_t